MFTPASSADMAQSLNFNLTAIQGYAELQALFDQWKLMRVSYRFRVYRSPDTNATAGAAAATLYPVIFHVTDQNDSGVGTSASLMEYPGCKVTVLSDAKPVSRWFSFVPKCSEQLVSAGFATPLKAPWLDTSTTSALYYGLKIVLTQATVGINVAVDWRYTVWCRNAK